MASFEEEIARQLGIVPSPPPMAMSLGAPPPVAPPPVQAPPPVAPTPPPPPPAAAAVPPPEQEQPQQPMVTPFSERMAMPQLVSRGHTSPAHEARTAPQSVLGAYDKAMTSEQAAGENIASRNILGAEARADVYRDEAEEAQQRAAAVEAASAKRSEELEARKKDFDETSATLAKTKIDPNRRWNEMSGGEKALNVFSILVGAVADGATGRENRALAQFEKQMERDINAQKFAYETGMNRLDQQRNAYALALQKYGSEDAAANVARMSYLDAAKMKIEQAMESANGDQAKNKLDAMYADIEGKRADLLAKTTTIVQAKAAEPMVRDPETGAVVPLSKYNERMWQRGEKQFGSRLDATKEVTVQGAKEGASRQDKTQAEVAKYYEDTSKPEYIEGKQLAEKLYAALPRKADGTIDRTKGLPGIGKGADVREAIAPADSINPARMVANAVIGLSPEEREMRLNYGRAGMAYRHAVTGAGGGEKELADIETKFAGAKTPVEQAAAIEHAHNVYSRLEDRRKRGLSRAARTIVETEDGNSGTGALAGVKRGWSGK